VGSSDARTSCTDTVITSTGFLAGAVAFPFPTKADLPLDGSGCWCRLGAGGFSSFGFAGGLLDLTPTSRFLRFSTACLAIAVIASIFGADTSSSLAQAAAEVDAGVFTFTDCTEVGGFERMSFLVVAVGRIDFVAGCFAGSFGVAVLLSPSVVFVPRSNRTRTCLRLGDVTRGGIAARDVTGDDTLGDRDTTHRVSRCGDGDAEDSLRALFWRRPLVGDGERLSDGVDVPDAAVVVSSLESVSTNSRDLYLVSRLVGCTGSLCASSTSAGVAGVPSGRHLCRVIRWRR